MLAAPSEPATLPVGVPQLPAMFQKTEQISELTRLVLSTAASDMAMPRVGFWGMGGIGKTVTGAAIVRDDAVREHFHAVVWLPLGQTPVISKLQNLCYMQTTGKELSPELSSEEKRQTLQQAMAGKRVLLCLDDLWEEQHEPELNCVDVAAGSKVLISTRVKALLTGAHQVEVGLPSPSDSARMLLAAADADLSTEPKGVREIVNLCGRLPLALGIAGRLAASLGLVDTGSNDWSGMLDVLREELHESSGGTEEGMIRASLRGLKGSAREQANVKNMLLLFALVPEDTHCPLEVLLLMYAAVHEGSTATIMHVRKWLRVLLNRCLVLGSVDRPSLHDLVLDWTIAQHSDDQLRDNHRRVINAFRASRPADCFGRLVYDPSHRGTPLSAYCCTEAMHHFSEAWQPDMENDREALTAWLGDVPQDELVLAAGQVLGVQRLIAVARRAESEGDWWLAGRHWAVASGVVSRQQGSGQTSETANKCLDATGEYLRLHGDRLSPEDLEAVHMVELDTSVRGLATCDGTFIDRAEKIEALLQTEVAKEDPVNVFACRIYASLPLGGQGRVEEQGKIFSDGALTLSRAARAHPDPTVKYRGVLMAYNLVHGIDLMLCGDPSFSWEALYGEGGELLLEAARSYEYDTVHSYLTEYLNIDAFRFAGGVELPMAVHFGDLRAAKDELEKSIGNMRKTVEEYGDSGHLFVALLFGIPAMSLLTTTTGLPKEAFLAFLHSMGYSWENVDTKLEELASKAHPAMRPAGDRTKGEGRLFAQEELDWLVKASLLLLSDKIKITATEVVSMLPSVETVQNEFMTMDAASQANATYTLQNLFVHFSAVCERFGEHEQVVMYSAAALETDLSKGGTRLPMNRTLALSMRGRALAALNRISEAAAALEAAVSEAHRYGLHLYEAWALRDLKLLVLDGLGHGDHGSRRLGSVLRLLKGPPEELAPMLKGLDVHELTSMPEPDPDFEVVYPGPDSGEEALRSELEGLRLKELRQRAREVGVSGEQLESAMDTDEPEASLIELVLARAKAAGAKAPKPQARAGKKPPKPKTKRLSPRAPKPKPRQPEPEPEPAASARQLQLAVKESAQWCADGTACSVSCADLVGLSRAVERQLGLTGVELEVYDDGFEEWCSVGALGEVPDHATVRITAGARA